jgi:hypothetical protein
MGRGYVVVLAQVANIVRLTMVSQLQAYPDVKSFVGWELNATTPHNKCKRRAYYALAWVFGWQANHERLDPCDGDGTETDGYPTIVHDVVNNLWSGEVHDQPVLLPSSPSMSNVP